MIIIGDIHGEFELLQRLIDKLPHQNLCFVGDLIDRGYFSCDVVEFVKNNNFKCVLGNHEEFMIASYNDNREPNEIHYMWDYNGAKNTINSYFNNQIFLNNLFFEHREWFKTLPLVYWIDELTVVSHSKYLPFLNDDINDPDVKENILWSRLHHSHPKTDILNIHGHTIISNPEIKGNYLNLDTGANYNKVLTAYDTETKLFYQVSDKKDFSMIGVGGKNE